MKLKGHTDNVKALVLNRDGTQVSVLTFIAFMFHIWYLYWIVEPCYLTDLIMYARSIVFLVVLSVYLEVQMVPSDYGL